MDNDVLNAAAMADRMISSACLQSSPTAVSDAVRARLANNDQSGAVALLNRVLDNWQELQPGSAPQTETDEVRTRMGIPLALWLLDQENAPDDAPAPAAPPAKGLAALSAEHRHMDLMLHARGGAVSMRRLR